ncbi:CHAT domain-containing protein [Cupriavidus sp. RAF12]|uniref:CHAT domain-containing protein n=1 Tax=Cupriavidus sp. RAF12 TaxID=3233050 RepID=UPI003F8FEB41
MKRQDSAMRLRAARQAGVGSGAAGPMRGAAGDPPGPRMTLGQKRPVPSGATASALKIAALRVEVVNGNLMFTDDPVLVGHYRGSALAGTEAVMDWLMGSAMSMSIRLGRYPHDLKTQQVFVNATADKINPLRNMPRPSGVVVVGLGDEGHLRASGLAATVRLGVIAWAQHLAESTPAADDAPVVHAPFTVAASLVGSGGTGMSAGQAARSVAEGVCEANRLLAAAGWPYVERLSLVELFLDRASEAWRALQLLDQACPGRYDIRRYIRGSTGALLRPLESSYRGADFDLITAVTQTDENGDSSIVYTLDTRRARTEVRAVAAQGRLLRELVTVASSNTGDDASVGRTLFKLLVPLEMRPFLAGASEMQIELDAGTAGIPWELLDSGRDADASEDVEYKPWAIRAKLLRKLRTQEFRRQVEDTARLAPMLVIGDPCSDDPRYPLLPGARREARAVSKLLSGNFGGVSRVETLVGTTDTDRGPDARKVVAMLLDTDWGIVHIAAHGQPAVETVGGGGAGGGDSGAAAATPHTDSATRAGGIVLSNGTFLGPEEFAKMQRVPELVFVNCCYLAHTDTAALLETRPAAPFHRPYFAASVADGLIKIGVRCVVAAGWAVDDAAAETFATSFYQALLNGRRFLDAVAIAREAAYRANPRSNTWAAYQCYGDADWCLPEWRDRQDRGAGDPAVEDEVRFAAAYSVIASPHGLLLAIEQVQTELRVNGADIDESCKRLRYLYRKFAQPEPRWERMGAVAEAFATAWREAGDLEEAVAWYQKAVTAIDSKATMYAAEQLANMQVRLALQRVRDASARASAQSAPGSAPQAALLQPVIDASRAQLVETTASLARLVSLHSSMERLALCGSASKRLAMVERFAGRREAEIAAVAEALRLYRAAEAAGIAQGAGNAFYAVINRCSAELVAHWMEGTPGDYQADWEGLVRASPERNNAEPDFWSRSALTEIWVYRCAAERTLARDLPSILNDLGKLQSRLPAINNWRTVRDQADFVLSEYMLQAEPAEKAAALRLQQSLERWAEAGGARRA